MTGSVAQADVAGDVVAAGDTSVSSDAAAFPDSADAADAAMLNDAAALADSHEPADAAPDPGCDPSPCGNSDDPCLVVTCKAAVCGTAPAPTDGSVACDDGDPCTVADRCRPGGCEGGPRAWLHVFGASGARISAVAATVDGGGVAVGNVLYAQPNGYDAWRLRVDHEGKPNVDLSSGAPGFDDLVVVTPHPEAGFAVGGSADGTLQVARLHGDGASLWKRTTLPGPGAPPAGSANTQALAVTGDGALVAGGMLALNSKTGDGWIAAWGADGDPRWTWSRDVPGRRVAVNEIVAAGASDDAGVVALGYDRLLPPGGSGSDLYTMWVIRVGGDGAQVWHRPLTDDITGAASGLVARAAGDFITLLDAPAGLVLQRVSASGELSKFATLPGGLIATASDLVPGPDDGVIIVRDATGGPVEIFMLDANGGTLIQTTIPWPSPVSGRVFGAAHLGQSALLLGGQLMQKASGSSSTTYRAFLRRVDLWLEPGCAPGDACLGVAGGCAPSPGCAGALCAAPGGCYDTGCAP